MATTFMETQQKQLLKKFHTLLGKAGVGQDGKEAILESYGVESSRELSAKELLDICHKLSLDADKALAELEQWRNRVIAAISAYHGEMGVTGFEKEYRQCLPAEKAWRIRYVKGTAEQAIGKDFEKIPLDRLRSLYYGFSKKAKDTRVVNEIAAGDLLKRVSLN
jgi:hypothetical protein